MTPLLHLDHMLLQMDFLCHINNNLYETLDFYQWHFIKPGIYVTSVNFFDVILKIIFLKLGSMCFF